MPDVTPLRAEDPDRVGRHRLTARISGMPGAGPYYLATAADGTEVSLRLLHGSWTHDAATRDRFAEEAGSAMRVPPFCAARILDAGTEDGYAYLVSEYVAGKSLLEIVSDDGKFGGPQLEGLAIGSATGLAAVHQAGLVHGNFGPEHVIMSASGPRIIEFGITPPYGSATPSADLLAWAQTMVFASMGRPPATLADLEVLPEPLRQAVTDCLVGDPALRPSAKSIVLDLLEEDDPTAGALAEGSRRAAQAILAAQTAREAQQARSARAGTGSRSARPSSQRRVAEAQRQRQQEQAAPDPDRAVSHHGGAEHAAHEHAGGRRRAPSGRRSGALAIAAAVVVIAAVAIVIVHVMQSASSPGGSTAQGGKTSTSPPPSSTSPVSSNASAAPSAVPTAFAGSWAGQAKQLNPSDVFNVKLNIPAGSSAGNIEYSSASFTCAGDLSLQSLRKTTLTLSQGIVTGQKTCANGIVTLSTGPNGVLQFSFRGKTGPAASGTLIRRS